MGICQDDVLRRDATKVILGNNFKINTRDPITPVKQRIRGTDTPFRATVTVKKTLDPKRKLGGQLYLDESQA
jgi:hypothetical protein